ncbi:hypothetical protein [Endozoicomonas sp. 4G]|uniref:hypothetical protein n=1 Tax=Endozoicomonas sp. 4G TaxID=2872754 RepID=UPI002078EE26|nr:hypothetical protein [Endozoicomonas sp. 4G]
MFKDNIVRILYIVVSIILVVVAYKYEKTIISDENNFARFSYFGTVITAIGFIVAVCEVMHSVHISKSIQATAMSLLEKVKLVESASTISDCLAAIDETNNNVSHEDYRTALCSFQYFRKLCVKVLPNQANDIKDSENRISELINEVEMGLLKAKKTTPDAPLTKRQKTDLMKKILDIKVEVENLNPAIRVKL